MAIEYRDWTRLDADAMGTLESLYRFGYYRYHPGFSQTELLRIEMARLLAAMHQPHAGVSAWVGSSLMAVAVIFRLDWDSGHFNREMSRLLVCHDGKISAADLADLIERSVNKASHELQTDHISVEVDIDDYEVVHACQQLGFQILDLKRAYCTNVIKDEFEPFKGHSNVRPYLPSDFAAVEALVRQAHFPSRFSRDPSLAQEQVSRLYQHWFRNLLDAAGSTTNALVFERLGEVVACGVIGETDLSEAGVPMRLRQGSLYAGRPDAVGAYVPVLFQLMREGVESHGLVETTVSMNNHVTTRVLERFRSSRPAVSRYAFRLNLAART